jgi:hypothetical protein
MQKVAPRQTDYEEEEDYFARRKSGDGRRGTKSSDEARRRSTDTPRGINGEVRRCRLTLSNPVLKAPMVSALEATI